MMEKSIYHEVHKGITKNTKKSFLVGADPCIRPLLTPFEGGKGDDKQKKKHFTAKAQRHEEILSFPSRYQSGGI